MKNMTKLGNLDITNKNSQITALEKQLFVTGHRNEMSLKAYSDVDVDEHKKISSILSYQSSQLQPSSQHYCNSSVEHPPSTASSYPLATKLLPHYNFSNCTVYFNSATMYDSPKFPSVKKRRVIIDSDSDE